MANNDFVIKRTAYGSFTIANAASTHSTGCIIPAGAIITGIKFIAPSAVTLTDDDATWHVLVGAAPIAATFAIKSLPAVTTLGTTSVAGPYIAASGELLIHEGTIVVSTAVGTYEVYVDYLYIT